MWEEANKSVRMQTTLLYHFAASIWSKFRNVGYRRTHRASQRCRSTKECNVCIGLFWNATYHVRLLHKLDWRLTIEEQELEHGEELAASVDSMLTDLQYNVRAVQDKETSNRYSVYSPYMEANSTLLQCNAKVWSKRAVVQPCIEVWTVI